MVRGRVVVLKVHSELFLFRCSYTDNGRLQAPKKKKKSTHIYIYIVYISKTPLFSLCFLLFCCYHFLRLMSQFDRV